MIRVLIASAAYGGHNIGDDAILTAMVEQLKGLEKSGISFVITAVTRQPAEMAKRLGMSRSQLYATAVRQYLDAHRSRGVTARLDQIYEYQDSSLDLRVAEAQTASFDDEDW